MSHISKLMIALGLALAAAMTNLTWLKAQTKPALFVSVGEEIASGQPITEASLVPIPVPGEANGLRSTFIPWEDRATILEYPAPRNYSAGDLIFRQDIRPQSERLEIVGPFRVVGDKERLNREPDDEFRRSRDGIVMIAVSAQLDERTKALLQMLTPNQDQQAVSRSIVSVQIVPSQAASQETEDNADIVYQPVALQGLENAPGNLQAGEYIRFVVAE